MDYKPPRSIGFLAAALLLSAACNDSDGPALTGPVSHRTELRQYGTCSDLARDLKNMLIADADVRIEQEGYYGRGGIDLEDGATADPQAPSDEGSRTEGEDYSGTNNQETGVDEADFVKTDGYHIYTINGNRLHIFGVPEFGQLVPESVTELEGAAREMLVDRDAGKLVVFSNIYPWALPEQHPLRQLVGVPEDGNWYWRSSDLTKLAVFDVSDPTNPALVREVFVEGWYQTARMTEGLARVGAYSWMNVPAVDQAIWSPGTKAQRRARVRQVVAGLRLTQLLPRLYERLPSGEVATIPIDRDQCKSFYRPSESRGRGVSSILSLNLFDDKLDIDADHIITNWATYYASKDNLYLAEPANDWWWFWWNDDHQEQTNIHVFDISTPGQSVYRGSGRVDGVLHNQFSLGEHDGHLRVATTENQWNQWWVEDPPEAENHVFVLKLGDDGLETVGHVGGIAPGERIFAARFVGERGYLVTFQMIDPLFTLDLSEPTSPRIAGELEIPGFSTYLHPIADDHLLAIGVGGDENGANWRTQISLFDVTDFSAPTMADREELVAEGDWGWSEAMYEHKAFQYWAPKKLLAVPLSTYRNIALPGGWRYQYESRLELISVDPDEGLASYGTIDHSHFFNTDPGVFWSHRDVRRSIFMGETIYAISDRGISVHALDDLSLMTQQSLPGYTPDDWYWWW